MATKSQTQLLPIQGAVIFRNAKVTIRYQQKPDGIAEITVHDMKNGVEQTPIRHIEGINMLEYKLPQ